MIVGILYKLMDDLLTETSEKKLRPRSMRHVSWNYAAGAWYEITICTKDPIPYFGKIDRTGKMKLSEIGKIVKEEWNNTEKLRPNVELNDFCIMQDHFHGIVIINNDDAVMPDKLTKKEHWQKGCLGSIINQFKGACTKRILNIQPHFAWQRSFYDHVIRNEKDLMRIQKYIRSNPEAYIFGKEGWQNYEE